MSLYEFSPKVFPLELILHEDGQFAGRLVLVHNQSCNSYHFLSPVFLYLGNDCHVPVVVDITEEDKPLTRYVFDRGEEPGPQGQVRDQWLCPYKSTGIMEYWSFGVLV